MRIVTIAAALTGLSSAAPLWAQDTGPQSLVVDPQQGATPRPPEPLPEDREPLPPVEVTPPRQVETVRSATVETLGPPPEIPFRRPDVSLETPADVLAAPGTDPLAIDRSSDPVLALAEAGATRAQFAGIVRSAIARHPFVDEAEAELDEAEAIRNEARALALPVIDFSLSHFRVIDREFSNDPQNILERSRPEKRTDALLRLTAPVIDFGRAQARIASGNERIAAAEANFEDSAHRLAQGSIAAWYQVFTYRALVRLGQAFLSNQDELRAALQVRIEQGVSAPADLAQYDGYRAAAQSQLAQFHRQLETAEAQYRAYVGEDPPAELGRAPSAQTMEMTRDAAAALALELPLVERARRLARAAEFDRKATEALEKPGVSVGVDAGRYGVFENQQDYDVRANVTLTHRFLGGAKQRTDQATARERRAEATFERIRVEAERDAEIAWADVQALEDATAAHRDNYFASRQSRDALFERFRYARGTLYDVLNAQTNYFNVATRFIASVSELDIARYDLLAKTGLLLDALGIDSAETIQP